LFGFVFGLSIFKIYNYDVWFHLAYGREVVTQGGLPQTEPFTFASEGAPAPNAEWLFGLLLYGVERLGGVSALTLLKAAVLALAFLVVYHDAQGRSDAPTFAFLLSGLAALASRGRFYERPEMFLLLFVALDVLILDRFVREGGRLIFFVPVIQLAWANLHGSAVLGPILVAAWFVGGATLGILAGNTGKRPAGALDRKKAQVLGAVLAATLMATAATPWGATSLHGAVRFVLAVSSTAPAGTQVSDVIKHHIMELQPLKTGELQSPYGILLAVGFVALLTWITLWIIRSRRDRQAPETNLFGRLARNLDIDLVRFGLAAAAVVLTFHASRFVALSAVLIAPAAARTFALLPAYVSSANNSRTRSRFAVATSFVAVVCLIGAGGWVVVKGGYQPGLGPVPGRYPEGAAGYLLSRGVQGPLLNTYQFGGYLEWATFPRLRPAVDGRGNVAAELIEPLLLAPWQVQHFTMLQNRFGLEAAVFQFPSLTRETSEALRGGVVIDNLPPGWALVYWDDAAIVLVREAGPNAAIARQDGLRALKPVEDYYLLASPRFGNPEIRRAIAADAERAMAVSPNDLRPALLVAKLAYQAGEIERAREIAEALRHRASNRRQVDDARVAAALLLGQIAEARGDGPAAIGYYREVLSIQPLRPQGQFQLAVLLEAEGRFEEAIEAYRDAVELNPSFVKAYQKLGGLLRATGDVEGARKAGASVRSSQQHALAEQYFYRGTQLYQAGHLEDAATAFRASLAESPRSAPARSNLGYVLYDLGRFEESMTEQLLALQADPKWANAHYGLGLAFLQLGNLERGREHFGKYLASTPRGHFSLKAEAYLRELER
jgi:tetratricopeptide (TPR) repeat protein